MQKNATGACTKIDDCKSPSGGGVGGGYEELGLMEAMNEDHILN